jgi:hypothetical protein
LIESGIYVLDKNNNKIVGKHHVKVRKFLFSKTSPKFEIFLNAHSVKIDIISINAILYPPIVPPSVAIKNNDIPTSKNIKNFITIVMLNGCSDAFDSRLDAILENIPGV